MKEISFSAEVISHKSYGSTYRTNHYLVMMDLDGNMYGWSTQGDFWATHLDIAKAFVKSETLMPNGKTYYEVERCKQELPKPVSFSC